MRKERSDFTAAVGGERRRFSRRGLRFLLANAVLALASMGFLLACLFLLGRQAGPRRAAEFAGDSGIEFGKLSVYMGAGDKLSLGDIYSFRKALLDKMSEASLELPAGGSSFVDAWCAFGSARASGGHGSAEVTVNAVGGEFFFFHPLRLKSGAYLCEDDVMDDLVVLDRELAWRLYGGDDLVGLTIMVNDRPFLIGGVVERDRDFASRKAKDEGNQLFMSYSAWNAMSEDRTTPIDCYELAAAQPVKGFLEGFMKEKFPLGGGELVNDSQRASLGGAWSALRQFGERSMRRTALRYPEWENAARCIEDWCALCVALAALFTVCPAVSALIALGIGLVRLRKYLSAKLPALASAAVDRAHVRRWERLHGKGGEG